MSDKNVKSENSDQMPNQPGTPLITSNEYREGRSALVIGMGLFGFAMAKHLTDLGWFVLAVDGAPERLKQIAKEVSSVRVIDAVNLEVIKTLEPSTYDLCISAIGDENAHMIATTIHNLKASGAKVVIARSTSKNHNEMFAKLGCDLIVEPEHYFGTELSEVLHHLSDYSGLKNLEIPKDYSIDLNQLKQRSIDLIKTTNTDSATPSFKPFQSLTLVRLIQLLVWILLLQYAYQQSMQLDLISINAGSTEKVGTIIGYNTDMFFKVTGALIVVWLVLSSYLKPKSQATES